MHSPYIDAIDDASEINKSKSIEKKDKVIMIMSDNRYPHLSNHFDLSLATTINYLYAQKYEYKFIYYKWKQSNITEFHQSSHERHIKWSKTCGGRSSPWCKLIGIYYTLNTFKDSNNDLVIYMDSDAVFVNPNINVEQYINNASNYLIYNDGNSLILPSNKPWDGVNSGTMIWSNNNISNCILKLWWNDKSNDGDKNCTHYYFRHSFEQWCLNHGVIPNNKFAANNIAVLIDTPCWEQTINKQRLWNHVFANRKRSARIQIFTKTLQDFITNKDIMNTTVNNTINKIKMYHTVVMDDSENGTTSKVISQLEEHDTVCNK